MPKLVIEGRIIGNVAEQLPYPRLQSRWGFGDEDLPDNEVPSGRKGDIFRRICREQKWRRLKKRRLGVVAKISEKEAGAIKILTNMEDFNSERWEKLKKLPYNEFINRIIAEGGAQALGSA